MTLREIQMAATSCRVVRDSYAPHWYPNLFRACDDHAVILANFIEVMSPCNFKRYGRHNFMELCGFGLKGKS